MHFMSTNSRASLDKIHSQSPKSHETYATSLSAMRKNVSVEGQLSIGTEAALVVVRLPGLVVVLERE
jgi:hypothetical protein